GRRLHQVRAVPLGKERAQPARLKIAHRQHQLRALARSVDPFDDDQLPRIFVRPGQLTHGLPSDDFELYWLAEELFEHFAFSAGAPEFELRIPAGGEEAFDFFFAAAAAEIADDIRVAAVEAVRYAQQRRADLDDPPMRGRTLGV